MIKKKETYVVIAPSGYEASERSDSVLGAIRDFRAAQFQPVRWRDKRAEGYKVVRLTGSKKTHG